MNWEAVGAIGEAIAAAGVIATLVYLALQIRQNTQTVRAATFQQAAAASTALAEQLSRDPELTRIFVSGVNELGSLSCMRKWRGQLRLVRMRKANSASHYSSLPMKWNDYWG